MQPQALPAQNMSSSHTLNFAWGEHWYNGSLRHTTMTFHVHSAAVCVSCQELASTLREGNLTCPGEEVIFKCTIRGSSTLPVLVLEWRSAEYIGQDGSLQLSTTDSLGEVEESMMDGIVTATATLINSTNIGGVLILESTLRIVANEASVVTCRGTNGVTESIEFSISGTYMYIGSLCSRYIHVRDVALICTVLSA